jgi:hypothetical protein
LFWSLAHNDILAILGHFLPHVVLSRSASNGGVFAGVASALAKMRTKMRITCVCDHANHAGAA